MPTPTSGPDPRSPAVRRRPRARGLLRTRSGIGILAAVGLVAAVVAGGLVGGVMQPTGNVAAASMSPAVPASPAISPPGSSANRSSEPASPSPTARTTPSPASTAAPASPPPTSPQPTAAPAGGVPAEALQARLERLRTRMGIPGVSVAILWDDGRRWLGASGLRDVAREDPMTTGTAFALASVSKTLTAAVVLQLVEEGALSLDQPVAPLLPAYDLHPRMTVRQLLDHTSGLPDYFLNPRIDRALQAAKDAAWTAEEAWAYVPPKRPRPGRRWIYSNANYLLLGELVEAVTGRPLSLEVRERLLDPLALETAWYQGDEEPRTTGTRSYRLVAAAGGGVRAVPVARRSDVMPFRSVVTAAGGAGSVAATALDAARWMQAFAGGDVLSPEMHAAMLGDVARTARLKPRLPYGLGIQALPIADRLALGHSGRFLGFRNVVRYLPGEGVTIAVLTNQGAKDPARIAEALLKLVLPPLPGASPSASPSATPSP